MKGSFSILELKLFKDYKHVFVHVNITARGGMGNFQGNC